MEISNEANAKILHHYVEIRKIAGKIAAENNENPYIVAMSVLKSLLDMEEARFNAKKISDLLGIEVEVEGLK